MTIPHENFTGTVITVKGRSPTTLSSPNTHPSLLGREGPLPYGSSMPLARAPNPRKRAPPLHLTNPAQRLQWPRTRCCAQYSSSSQEVTLANTDCTKPGDTNTHISTCLQGQESGYRLIPRSLPPTGANKSVHTPQAFLRRRRERATPHLMPPPAPSL